MVMVMVRTETPAEEEGHGENNSDVEHAPFEPLVLRSVGHQRHDEQPDERKDAAKDHDIHALVLEPQEVEGNNDERHDVDG